MGKGRGGSSPGRSSPGPTSPSNRSVSSDNNNNGLRRGSKPKLGGGYDNKPKWMTEDVDLDYSTQKPTSEYGSLSKRKKSGEERKEELR